MAYRKKFKWGLNKPPLGTQINRGHPLALGLTHCWLFNESAGTTCYQSADYTHNASFDTSASGILTWGGSPFGVALTRSNNNTTHTGLTFSTITSGTTWTWDTYINCAGVNTGSVYSNLMAAGNLSGIWFHTTNKQLDFFYTSDHFSTTAISFGVWHHYAISVNGGSVTYYLDGRSDGTSTSAPSIAFTGMMSDNGGAFLEGFNGTVLYERLWIGRALSNNEIFQLPPDPFGMYVTPRIGLRQGPASVAGGIGKYRTLMGVGA